MFERPKRGVGCARGAPEATVIQIATKVDAAVFCNRISFDARSKKPERRAKTEILFPPFGEFENQISFVFVARSALTDD